MFISYTGPDKRDPGVRGVINAYAAANASLKRQQRRDRPSNHALVASQWLHERPLFASQPQQQQARAGKRPIRRTTTTEEAESCPQEAYAEQLNVPEEPIEWPVSDGVVYPVPKQSYYPSLMFTRQNLFLLVAHQYPKTFAHMIYTSWTQTVLSDPCLFNATLYSTSSWMDIMQGKRNNPVTLRHKVETIRLIKDAVSQSPAKGLSANMIAVTTYFVYFSKLLGQFEEANQHDAGITAMVKFRGANTIPYDTYPTYLLRLRDVWNRTVSQDDTLYPSLPSGPRPRFGHYTSLLAIAIRKQQERSPELRLPPCILHFLLTFNNHCIGSAGTGYFTPPPETSSVDSTLQAALQTLYITSTIYEPAVRRSAHEPYRKTDHEAKIQKLKLAILQIDPLFWLRFGPEVYRWVLMTGATAAATLSDQAFFIMRCYMITSIIEPDEMEEFLVAADQCLWVFNHQPSSTE